MSFDFDARVHTLTEEIKEEWEPNVKAIHKTNRRKTEEGLIYEYGILDFHQKQQNFIDLGSKPWSILAFHNKFQSQARNSFIIGSYYPALTAVCALGERILNHLILRLRDYYRKSELYKKVYRKESFDNWELAITALDEWKVLLPEATILFKELNVIRNKSIHFRPETDDNDRELALSAIKVLSGIIQKQFGSLGGQPWFIPVVAGEIYIRKSFENVPFIQEIYIPNCAYVGPKHNIEIKNNKMVVHDNNDYEDREITDEEFNKLRYPKKKL